MNELIITIMLIIPSPSKIVNWSVNKVPTQIQIIHESGLEVSYNAAPVSCKFRPRNSNEMMFRSSREHCYAVYDLDKPRFVRHPYFWHKIQLSENKVTGE